MFSAKLSNQIQGQLSFKQLNKRTCISTQQTYTLRGTPIQVHIRKIDITTSFVAELWALRDGLSMCVDMQIPALEVELDAKVVADLMNNTTSLNADFAAIVGDCRQLLSQIPQVKVSHCYREANRWADALARLGCTTSLNVMFFNFPPLVF